MRETLKRLRTIALALTLAVAFYDRAAVLGASSALPSCGEICSDSSCETECETWVGDVMWFTTCGEYGVCIAEPYCGDGICQLENGEDYNNCQDCPPPPPPPPPPPSPRTIVLVNGAITEDPTWIYQGSAMSNAIAATYGQQPIPFLWLNNDAVFYPEYGGIYAGGFELGNVIAALPQGHDVHVITHSHGGNVAIISTFWANRQIKNLINLATPINWDLLREVGGAGVVSRCTVSGSGDWVQFVGSSPFQIYGFASNVWAAIDAGWEAAQALANEDWELFFYWSALSAYYYFQADEWWDSTKVEWEGPTYSVNVTDHGDMHEPAVWNAIAAYCATPG